MPVYSIVLIVSAAVIAALTVIFTVFSYIIYRAAFFRRIDKNPSVRFFTEDDFSLSAVPVKIGVKPALCGKVYGDGKSTVVFCHGMGAGHGAYTTEIAALCRDGYRVVAFDVAGCGMSEGDMRGGFAAGVKCAVEAYKFASSNYGGKIYFAGHSLGAYSALCATKFCKAAGVVAISAPDSAVAAVCGTAANYISRPLAVLMYPFIALWCKVYGGKYGCLRASACVEKSGVPALLIHGDCDGVVPPEKSAYGKARGGNVTKYNARGKGHNPYNTPAAEKALARLSQCIALSAKDEKAAEELKNFDYVSATEEDVAVMNAITQFLSQIG